MPNMVMGKNIENGWTDFSGEGIVHLKKDGWTVFRGARKRKFIIVDPTTFELPEKFISKEGAMKYVEDRLETKDRRAKLGLLPKKRKVVDHRTVRLMAADGKEQHAQGILPLDVLDEAHLLERRGRTYHFAKMDGMIAVFYECQPAYRISTF